ncbi:MAG: type IX secretion system membrane protein PorP/SprF [Bacteroidales bacterium]|nr:type IX secretion system membrane protein PorP/SprF [Bacteroidales bacterium]
MKRFRAKIYLLLFLAGFVGVGAFAQQDPQFSQNMFNHLAVNPGFAGSQGMLNAGMINRQQWMGFPGNPTTTVFSVHAPVKPLGIPSGVGLTFIDDRLGFEKNTTITLNYAYRLSIGEGTLGIGANVGLLSREIDGKWSIPDSDNHSPASSDPSIPDEQASTTAFDLGFGLFYNNDNLYAGLSSTHLLEPILDYGNGAFTYMRRHYYGTVGYLFKLANPVYEIQPSLFAKYDGASFQTDVNMMLVYNKRFWGGVSYRLGDAVVVMAGTELANGLRLGIAYDFTTSAIATYSHGTVEFMLGYNLAIGTDKLSQRYKSVRFL